MRAILPRARARVGKTKVGMAGIEVTAATGSQDRQVVLTPKPGVWA